MEITQTPSASLTELVLPSTSTTPPILRLRLQKKKSPKNVVWSDGTVDNEHMNKKKSKCCCIYKKPSAFGESSSEDEEECEHCFGHPEKRVKTHSRTDPNIPSSSGQQNQTQHSEADESEEHHNYHCHSGVCTLRTLSEQKPKSDEE